MKNHESRARMKGEHHVFTTYDLDYDIILCGHTHSYSLETTGNERGDTSHNWRHFCLP